MASDPLPRPLPASDADAPAPASGPCTVLTLAELAEGLVRLQPPPAYRLGLDSGVEYNNVRRALAQPGRARVATWHKLLRSLHIRMLVAEPGGGGVWPIAGPRRAGPGTEAAPGRAAGLRELRRAHGWSRRALAARAGVSVDTIAALEGGGGLLGNLDRVCGALDLRLVFALPPRHGCLASLWRERAVPCLERPAQFPPAPPRARVRAQRQRQAQISASMASAAASAPSSARLTASGPAGKDAQAATWACASPDSVDSVASSKAT